MIAKRTKHLKLGLLPRMDARPRAKGGWTFRYYTYDRKYINLGHDRAKAIKRVLEMEQRAPDTGTVAELLRQYMASGSFKNELAPRTQDDYIAASKEILERFADMPVEDVKPPHAAKKGPSSHVIGLMAKFIALTGRRRAEFLNLRKTDLGQVGIVVGFATANAGDTLRRGLIEWTPTLRQLFAELAQLDRKARDGKSAIPESMFVFTNRDGQPYTEQGFKAPWSKIMGDWVEVAGRERFTFHDLRAYYVTVLVGRDENPETHANPATTRRILYPTPSGQNQEQCLTHTTILDSCHHFAKRRKEKSRYKRLISIGILGVADGTRTHDNRNHNPGLYQLSYSHHWSCFAHSEFTEALSTQRVFETCFERSSTTKRPNSSTFF